jgi:hypothetical protein
VSPRLLVPFLLCAGLLIVPLVALSGGGPRTPGGMVRVAAGAPVVAAPTPDPSVAPADTVVTDAPPVSTAAAVEVASVAPSTSAAAPVAPVAKVHAASVPTATRRTAISSTPSSSVPPTTRPPAPAHTESGGASWYDTTKGTCAHQTLPFGTVVHIRATATGKTAVCTVEDRGPYVDGRIIDLAPDVFQQLATTSEGVIEVQIAW